MPSRRQMILTELLARARSISIDNGYATDAGERVFFGEAPEFGDSDQDPVNAIVMVVQDSQPQDRSQIVADTVAVEFQATARADLEQPYVAAEDLLSDIMRAVEQPDRTLGSLAKGEMAIGAIRTVPREPGMTSVAMGVTYVVPYHRRWGQP